jgi:hypothetical protein
MKKFVKKSKLNNNIEICFYDLTKNYYGDYFFVRVEACCKIPLTDECLGDLQISPDIRRLLGDEVVYARIMEKMGIQSAQVDEERNKLISDFESNSMPYIASERFPAHFISKEIARLKSENKLNILS